MTLAYSDPACPECWHYLLCGDGAPAPDIVQEALGGSPDALARFFSPDDWLRNWTLPLTIVWGRAAEWQTVASWWRAARDRRERRERFLSLEEINAGWSGGEDG